MEGVLPVYRITAKEDLSPIDYFVEVEAPHVARAWKPGQFVVFVLHERGERVPMSVYKAEDGKVGMFIRKQGKTSLLKSSGFRLSLESSPWTTSGMILE